MTLRKHGVGEVLPEPDDEATASFTPVDQAELAQELKAEEPASDRDQN